MNIADELAGGDTKKSKTSKTAGGSSKSSKSGPKPKKAAAAENGEVNGKENVDVCHADPLNVFENLEKATEGGKKRLSIERIYQKKTQLEHILLRPDTYIGSVESVTQVITNCIIFSQNFVNIVKILKNLKPMWVYDAEKQGMVSREITFVPGLYKIFDEIIVNAADNKQRDKNMTCLKIKIDP